MLVIPVIQYSWSWMRVRQITGACTVVTARATSLIAKSAVCGFLMLCGKGLDLSYQPQCCSVLTIVTEWYIATAQYHSLPYRIQPPLTQKARWGRPNVHSCHVGPCTEQCRQIRFKYEVTWSRSLVKNAIKFPPASGYQFHSATVQVQDGLQAHFESCCHKSLWELLPKVTVIQRNKMTLLSAGIDTLLHCPFLINAHQKFNYSLMSSCIMCNTAPMHLWPNTFRFFFALEGAGHETTITIVCSYTYMYYMRT